MMTPLFLLNSKSLTGACSRRHVARLAAQSVMAIVMTTHAAFAAAPETNDQSRNDVQPRDAQALRGPAVHDLASPGLDADFAPLEPGSRAFKAQRARQFDFMRSLRWLASDEAPESVRLSQEQIEQLKKLRHQLERKRAPGRRAQHRDDAAPKRDVNKRKRHADGGETTDADSMNRSRRGNRANRRLQRQNGELKTDDQASKDATAPRLSRRHAQRGADGASGDGRDRAEKARIWKMLTEPQRRSLKDKMIEYREERIEKHMRMKLRERVAPTTQREAPLTTRRHDALTP